MKKIFCLCLACLFAYVSAAQARVEFITKDNAITFKSPNSAGCKSGETNYGGRCIPTCSSSIYPFEKAPDAKKGVVEPCSGIKIRYRYTECNAGYEWNSNKTNCILKDCSGYPVTEDGLDKDAGTYEPCQSGDTTTYKYLSCNRGWNKQGLLCIANICSKDYPNDYDAIKPDDKVGPHAVCYYRNKTLWGYTDCLGEDKELYQGACYNKCTGFNSMVDAIEGCKVSKSCISKDGSKFKCTECDENKNYNKEPVDGKCKKSKEYICYVVEKDDDETSIKEVDASLCDCEHYDERPSSDIREYPIDFENCSVAKHYCLYKNAPQNSEDSRKVFVSKECGVCSSGYKLNDKKDECVEIPCDGPKNTYWYGNYSGEFDGICTAHDSCIRNDLPTNWSESNAVHSFDNGIPYGRCTACKTGYTLINNACVKDSGVGSLYKYNDTPIGIVFYEDDKEIKIMSLEEGNQEPISWMDEKSVHNGSGDGTKGDGIIHTTNLSNISTLADDKDCSKDSNGAENTKKILAYNPNYQAAKIANDYAPAVCNADSICGKGKWYLPAIKELVQLESIDGLLRIHAVRGANNLIQPVSELDDKGKWINPGVMHGVHGINANGNRYSFGGYYWSSTEASDRLACQAYAGKKGQSIKDSLFNVRPVLTIKKTSTVSPDTSIPTPPNLELKKECLCKTTQYPNCGTASLDDYEFGDYPGNVFPHPNDTVSGVSSEEKKDDCGQTCTVCKHARAFIYYQILEEKCYKKGDLWLQKIPAKKVRIQRYAREKGNVEDIDLGEDYQGNYSKDKCEASLNRNTYKVGEPHFYEWIDTYY